MRPFKLSKDPNFGAKLRCIAQAMPDAKDA